MTIIRIYSPISLADIEIVTAGLETATGGSPKITITETFDLDIQDERQLKAIKALFDTGHGKPDHMPSNKNMPGTGGAFPYTITATGEQVSGRALRARIKAGLIPPGTKLINSKKRPCIVNSKGGISKA